MHNEPYPLQCQWILSICSCTQVWQSEVSPVELRVPQKTLYAVVTIVWYSFATFQHQRRQHRGQLRAVMIYFVVVRIMGRVAVWILKKDMPSHYSFEFISHSWRDALELAYHDSPDFLHITSTIVALFCLKYQSSINPLDHHSWGIH